MTGGCVFDGSIFINYWLNYPVSYISAKKKKKKLSQQSLKKMAISKCSEDIQ